MDSVSIGGGWGNGGNTAAKRGVGTSSCAFFRSPPPLSIQARRGWVSCVQEEWNSPTCQDFVLPLYQGRFIKQFFSILEKRWRDTPPVFISFDDWRFFSSSSSWFCGALLFMRASGRGKKREKRERKRGRKKNKVESSIRRDAHCLLNTSVYVET